MIQSNRFTIGCLATAVILLLFASSAQAQTPTSVSLRVYPAGQPAAPAVTAQTFALAAWTCGVKPKALPVANPLNPTRWTVDDPADPQNADCVLNDVTRFTALTDGTYEGTAQYNNADGPSTAGEGPRVPFVRRRPNPPSASTNLRITP